MLALRTYVRTRIGRIPATLLAPARSRLYGTLRHPTRLGGVLARITYTGGDSMGTFFQTHRRGLLTVAALIAIAIVVVLVVAYSGGDGSGGGVGY
jgi:hypothetical protein